MQDGSGDGLRPGLPPCHTCRRRTAAVRTQRVCGSLTCLHACVAVWKRGAAGVRAMLQLRRRAVSCTAPHAAAWSSVGASPAASQAAEEEEAPAAAPATQQQQLGGSVRATRDKSPYTPWVNALNTLARNDRCVAPRGVCETWTVAGRAQRVDLCCLLTVAVAARTQDALRPRQCRQDATSRPGTWCCGHTGVSRTRACRG